MILLDTNVVSELWKPEPSAEVLRWIDAQAVETLFLSAITVAELRYGIAALPEGRRRTVLHERMEGEVLPLFAGRVLPFDIEATLAYAGLTARARASGRAISAADGYIAAVALARHLVVATRDVSPFLAAGAEAIDPWQPRR
ncbi:MAG TPA: type II toxin-antitoxin system VapC family toxin [Ensifer sp.]|nr:type II toxin-antitoxin system VapC family toxin [Ensifer sp.]